MMARTRPGQRQDEKGPTKEEEILMDAAERGDAETVRWLIQDGVNVDCVNKNKMTTPTPLLEACHHGHDEIVRILLDAGAMHADYGDLPLRLACSEGHLSVVELLVNHDHGLVEIAEDGGMTPLFGAIIHQHAHIVRFLLDRGANVSAFWDIPDMTTLMRACLNGNLEIVRMLIAAGVNVEARNRHQETALHVAAQYGHIEVVHELIFQYNANMSVVDEDEKTPFDAFCPSWTDWTGNAVDQFLDIYGNKMTQDQGRLALHAILGALEVSFTKDSYFHPPLNPLQVCLPLGKLTLKHFRTLLHTFDTEVIRNRDDCGKLPIHIACRSNAPVEILAVILELDPATLHIADHSGGLPIHECCYGKVDDSSVQCLVEQGGVGTLSARNREGELPLHLLCGSTNPSLRIVQYMIRSFPGSVMAQTNAGQYPFMIAACESSTASLSVVYELVRTDPGSVGPR